MCIVSVYSVLLDICPFCDIRKTSSALLCESFVIGKLSDIDNDNFADCYFRLALMIAAEEDERQ